MSGCRATARLTAARLSQMWVCLHDDRARFWPAVASVQADGSAAGRSPSARAFDGFASGNLPAGGYAAQRRASSSLVTAGFLAPAWHA